MLARSGLRILAYHDVPDVGSFHAQIGYLARHYDALPGPWHRRETSKPPVWVTFDDGDPTIVQNALPVLMEHGVPATAFICPGVIETNRSFWWQVVEDAASRDVRIDGAIITPMEVRRLKGLDDTARRERVNRIRDRLESGLGTEVNRRQLTRAMIDEWLGAGNDLGNHTWDHPLLDRCDPDEQEFQIVRAHQWFADNGLPLPEHFAYPNGNHSAQSESVLRRLGYRTGLLFDHGVSRDDPPFRMSRIRVNATDGMREFAAKVSGAHPWLARRASRIR